MVGRGKYTCISHNNHYGKVIGKLPAREEFRGNSHPPKAVVSSEYAVGENSHTPHKEMFYSYWEGKLPKNSSQGRNTYWIFPGHCRWRNIYKPLSRDFFCRTRNRGGNFPKTLPREEIVIAFFQDTAGGEKSKKKYSMGNVL